MLPIDGISGVLGKAYANKLVMFRMLAWSSEILSTRALFGCRELSPVHNIKSTLSVAVLFCQKAIVSSIKISGASQTVMSPEPNNRIPYLPALPAPKWQLLCGSEFTR